MNDRMSFQYVLKMVSFRTLFLHKIDWHKCKMYVQIYKLKDNNKKCFIDKNHSNLFLIKHFYSNCLGKIE